MPKPFDLLNVFAAFGREQSISLRDLQAADAFIVHARTELAEALADPVLLYGLRTQAMFEALLVSLGQFKLLKSEDSGRLHPQDQYRAPDFRVVLTDGSQWLIEVKNVYVADPMQQRRRLMGARYLDTLQNYAETTGAALKIAVYWARWGVWTLVSPERLLDAGGGLEIEMAEAMRLNEMGALGDMTIGTQPQLRLRIVADLRKPNAVDADGIAPFTIGDVATYCGAQEITNPTEKEIAWILMQFGDWVEREPTAIISDGCLEAIEYVWEPREQVNQGFEMIGTLSAMFSRYYALQTLADREVVQIEANLRPGWFAPLASKDYAGEALPLWRFIVQPAAD